MSRVTIIGVPLQGVFRRRYWFGPLLASGLATMLAGAAHAQIPDAVVKLSLIHI